MLIIFDLDGTLYNTSASVITAINRACVGLDIPPPPTANILNYIGLPGDVYFKKLFPNINEDKKLEISRISWAYELEEIKKSGNLYSGVKQMLSDLKIDHTLVICSNGGERYVNTVLDHFKIKQYFTEISSYSSKELKASRVKRLRDKYSYNAVVIGDKGSDFIAAKDANIPSIGVIYGFGSKEELDHATIKTDSCNNIVSLIKKLEIFYKIENNLERLEQYPKITGITGVDNAGKTEFAKALYTFLLSRGKRTSLLHLDDFHNSKKVRYQLNDPVESYIQHAFNLEKIEGSILKPLKADGYLDTTLKLLDIEKDAFSKNNSFVVQPDSIVIFEGVLLFRPPLNKYIDYKVFVDIDFDQMVPRALKRDGGKIDEISRVYETKRIPIQKKFFDQFEPQNQSNLVVNNNDFFNPQIINERSVRLKLL